MKATKQVIAGILIALTLLMAAPAVAQAQTVWFRGVAVSWAHGRTGFGLYSYSTVVTSEFKHCATANSTWSGWKSPGTTAHATQFIGNGKAEAYWNCR